VPAAVSAKAEPVEYITPLALVNVEAPVPPLPSGKGVDNVKLEIVGVVVQAAVPAPVPANTALLLEVFEIAKAPPVDKLPPSVIVLLPLFTPVPQLAPPNVPDNVTEPFVGTLGDNPDSVV